MSVKIVQTDTSYKAPPNSIHLTSKGWIFDSPEIIKFILSIELESFVDKLYQKYENILGDGEMTVAIFRVESDPSTETKVYTGRVYFIPNLDA